MIRFEQINPKPDDYNVAASPSITASASVVDQVELMANLAKVLEDRFGLGFDPQNPGSALSHAFGDTNLEISNAGFHIPFLFDSSISDEVMMGTMGTGDMSVHSASALTLEVEAGKILKLVADDQNEDEVVTLDNNDNRLKVESKIGTDDASAADDNASVLVKSTLGGIKMSAPAAKDIYASAGQIAIASLDDAASAISLLANTGSAETISIRAQQSEVEGSAAGGALDLLADAGGIRISAAADKDLYATGGQVSVISRHNTAQAILLETGDTHTDATIKINARSGTNKEAMVLEGATGGWKGSFGKRIVFTAGGAGTAVAQSSSVQSGSGSPVNYAADGFIADLQDSETFIDNTLWLDDENSDTTWAAGFGLPLSVATDEWTQYKDTFGEVSLLGALYRASAGSTDSFYEEIEMGATLTSPADIYGGTLTAHLDESGQDISAQGAPSLDANTSEAELLARVEVYVNGQRMALTGDCNVTKNGNVLGLNFDFDLEQGDIVIVKA